MNFRATFPVITVAQKVAGIISEALRVLLNQRETQEYEIKHFVVSVKKLDFIEYFLEGAFVADKNDLFYQREDSEDWKLLKSFYKEIDIEDPEGYKR
jgi:hypothetical protein